MNAASTLVESCPTHSTHCPVCAGPLSGLVEVCTRCQTPHHQDCARFAGRCAVFGCGWSDFLLLDVESARILVSDERIDDQTGPRAFGRASSFARVEPHDREAATGQAGAFDRAFRAASLLWTNRPLVAGIVAVSALVTAAQLASVGAPRSSSTGPAFFLGSLVAAVLPLLTQSLFTIVVAGRAQGKEWCLTDAAWMALGRLGRVLLALVQVSLAAVPVLCVCATLGGALGPVAMLPLMVVWLVFFYPLTSIATIVASMGRDAEPDGMLSRSLNLLWEGRAQLVPSACVMVLGWLALAAATYPAMSITGHSLVFMACTQRALGTAFSLGALAYWFLFYVEMRRTA